MSEQAMYDRELAAYQQEYRDLAEAAQYQSQLDRTNQP